MRDVLDSAILINMHIQPLRLMIHRLHAAGLQDAMFFGQIGFGECLRSR